MSAQNSLSEKTGVSVGLLIALVGVLLTGASLAGGLSAWALSNVSEDVATQLSSASDSVAKQLDGMDRINAERARAQETVLGALGDDVRELKDSQKELSARLLALEQKVTK